MPNPSALAGVTEEKVDLLLDLLPQLDQPSTVTLVNFVDPYRQVLPLTNKIAEFSGGLCILIFRFFL